MNTKRDYFDNNDNDDDDSGDNNDGNDNDNDRLPSRSLIPQRRRDGVIIPVVHLQTGSPSSCPKPAVLAPAYVVELQCAIPPSPYTSPSWSRRHHHCCHRHRCCRRCRRQRPHRCQSAITIFACPMKTGEDGPPC